MKPPGQLHRSSSLRSGSLSRKPGNGASSSNRLERRQSERKPRKAMKRTKLRRESRKHKAESSRWSRAKAVRMKQTGGRCEVRVKGCTVRATDAHHKLPRGRGGKTSNTVPVVCCRNCHDFVELNKPWATEQGFVLSGRQHVLPVTTRKMGRAAA